MELLDESLLEERLLEERLLLLVQKPEDELLGEEVLLDENGVSELLDTELEEMLEEEGLLELLEEMLDELSLLDELEEVLDDDRLDEELLEDERLLLVELDDSGVSELLVPLEVPLLPVESEEVPEEDVGGP